MTFAVCDDQSVSRSLLADYVRRYCHENSITATVLEYSSGEQLTADFDTDTSIVFLDILMGAQNGIETAARINQLNRNTCVIFITSAPQYALECYRVHPFGFLVKPVSYYDFENEMCQAMEKLSLLNESVLSVREKDSGNFVSIPCSSIYYVEVKQHYIYAVQDQRTVVFRGALSEFEAFFRKHGFLRCHQSYLVNATHIKSVGRMAMLDNDMNIPISQSRRSAFLKQYMQLMGDMI